MPSVGIECNQYEPAWSTGRIENDLCCSICRYVIALIKFPGYWMKSNLILWAMYNTLPFLTAKQTGDLELGSEKCLLYFYLIWIVSGLWRRDTLLQNLMENLLLASVNMGLSSTAADFSKLSYYQLDGIAMGLHLAQKEWKKNHRDSSLQKVKDEIIIIHCHLWT